ncbi:MAG: hypothetical protein ACK5NC_06380 [Vibrio sp.]
MISRIGKYLLLIIMFTKFAYCNAAVAPVSEKVIKNKEVFLFYKSFPFCGNDYSAFSPEEASQVYKDMKIYLESNGKSVNLENFFYQGAKLCLKEELSETYQRSFLFITKESFPFNNGCHV